MLKWFEGLVAGFAEWLAVYEVLEVPQLEAL